MYAQWTNEQETIYPWLGNPSVSEQENVLDWIKSIGSGAAQGAGSGVVAGPWGALIGALAGAGLGALQQATQQQSAPRPSPVQSAPPPPASTPAPQPVPPAPSTAGARDGLATTVQQVTQLLPQLIQLIQTIQPVIASAQQSKGRAKESNDDEGRVESLAGDPVPESAFMNEQIEEISEAEDDEHIDLPEPAEPAQSYLTGALPPPNSLEPSALLSQLTAARTLTFPSEWVTEGESVAIVGSGFQWFG